MPVESHSHSGVCAPSQGSRITARGINSGWRRASLTLVFSLVTPAVAENSPPAIVVGTLIWRTVGSLSCGGAPRPDLIRSMSSGLRTSLARQSWTALAPSVIEPPPMVTMRSAPAVRAWSAAATTAARGVCGGIASKVPTQRGPSAWRIFSISSVSRFSVPLTMRNARCAPSRSNCSTIAPDAGRPNTTSSIAPNTTRPLCTSVLPGPFRPLLRALKPRLTEETGDVMHEDGAVATIRRQRRRHPRRRHVFVTSRRLAEAFVAMRPRYQRSAKARDLPRAGRRLRECMTIVLDPCGFLTRLGTDHICGLRQSSTAAFIHQGCRDGRWGLTATEQLKRPALPAGTDMRSPHSLKHYGLKWLTPLLALALTACGDKPPQQPAAAAPPVTVAQPVKRTVTDWDEFTGRFDAVQEVQVRARVGGFVTSVEFRDGSIVKTGDLLYVIDARPFEAVAEQANGQLSDARAKAELAKRELDRALTLNQTQAVSDSIVDQRRQTLQAAHAAEMQAEGTLKAAQLNIEFAHVVAPITGRVSRHLVTPGNLVQGSEGGATLLTSIVSLDPIYIYFDVDEATYQRNSRLWSEGKRPSSRDTANPVQVTLTGETKPSHEGKMDFLDNRLNVSTGTLRTRAVIPNKNLSILPGQFGRVRIIGSSPYEALLLPDTAVATDQSRKIVFVVKDDNTVEAKPVTLGPLDEGLRVIREGLQPEDRVIVDGLQRARVGAKVTPHTAEVKPAGGKT